MATCINVCFLVFSLALLPSVPVRAEMFTALVHMEGLVALEKELLAGLESYLQVERERLEISMTNLVRTFVCMYVYVWI